MDASVGVIAVGQLVRENLKYSMKEEAQNSVCGRVVRVHINLDLASLNICVNLNRICETRRAKVPREPIVWGADQWCIAASSGTLAIVEKHEATHLVYQPLYGTSGTREVEFGLTIHSTTRIRATHDLDQRRLKIRQVQVDRSGSCTDRILDAIGIRRCILLKRRRGQCFCHVGVVRRFSRSLAVPERPSHG